MNKIKWPILLLLLFCGSNMLAQNREITGKVTNKETGEPLKNISVLADKSKNGTATKADGTFSISVKQNSAILIFSSVGYATQSVVIGDKNVVNASMSIATVDYSEVVVIGYGTQKRGAVTGAVSKYKNEKLDQSPVSRLDQALQGKIAGVTVQNISSEAGSDPKVQVRGVSSLSANKAPLVVVDGHPVPDGLSFVNMGDVESVEVLKDAASAAIYGSRGANGVILVTTKTGKNQKAKYHVRMSIGNKNPIKVYPIISTVQYLEQLYAEAALRFADTGFTNYATTAQLAAKANFATAPEKASYLLEKDFFGNVPTDWQHAALRTGVVKNVDLSVNGGSKDYRYYLSGTYQNDEGMMINSEYERFNVKSKFDLQLNNKLKIVFNVNPSYFKRERPSTNFTDFARVQTYLPLVLDERTAAFIRQNPANANVRAGDFGQPRSFNDLPYSGTMPDGTTFTNPAGTAIAISSSANNSPYSVLKNEKITTNDYRVLTSGDATYTIIPGLSAKVLLSAYVNNTSGLDFAKTNTNRQGDVSKGIYTSRTYVDLLNENTLNYTKRFGGHSINVLAGFTAQKRRTQTQQTVGLNYISDNITTLNTALAIDQANTVSDKFGEGLLSYLGRASYSYADKYLVLATFRTDGSSIFGPGNKWGSFPSLSLGWVASKEKFLQNTKWLDNLKFRASYGATGNNAIPAFSYTDLLFPGNYIAGAGNGTSTLGLTPSVRAGILTAVQANPNITWERTFQNNFGIDISVFKNLVTLSVDAYRSKTEKLLLTQAAPAITGIPFYFNNIGKLQNDGLELELTTNNIRNKKFTWTTSGNIAFVNNKILALGNETALINAGERQDGYISQVGGHILEFYGLKTDGIWLSQAEVNAAVAKGLKSPLSGYFAPGALKFADVNGDNVIDLNDRTSLGNPYPDFTYGLTNSFAFAGVDLSFTFQGVKGGKVLNGDGFYNEARKYNKAFTENRWISPANPGDGKTPYFTNGYTNAWTQSDYLLSSASYLALRELLIGYTLPKNIADKAHLNGVRVYASVQNLFFKAASDYKGLNIEARSNAGPYASPLIDGYQRGAFPTNRTTLVGVELNF